MSSLTHLAKLRGLMLDMESEVGLTDVSHLERDVMLACVELKDAAPIVKTKDILAHRFLKSSSRPSIFRALKSLIDQDHLAYNGKGPPISCQFRSQRAFRTPNMTHYVEILS